VRAGIEKSSVEKWGRVREEKSDPSKSFEGLIRIHDDHNT